MSTRSFEFISLLFEMSKVTFSCELCSFSTKCYGGSWRKHLLEEGHQRRARKRSDNLTIGEKRRCAVVFGLDDLPRNEVLQFFSSQWLVTDFVFWNDRLDFCVVEFLTRSFCRIAGGTQSILGKEVVIKSRDEISDIEWKSLRPLSMSMDISSAPDSQPTATILGTPSPSSSKNQLETECEIPTSNRLRSSTSKVSTKELPTAAEQRDTQKPENSNRSFQKVGQSEGKSSDSAAAGESSVDSDESSSLDLQCPICKKTYKTKWSLKAHKQIHNPEKKFVCFWCSKCFHRKAHLEVHLRTHTNERPFKCSFCREYFRTSTTRRNHELIHRNLKPYKCPFCAKWFRHLPTLSRHKLGHSNEKRYVCLGCSKAFRKASQLSRHEEIHRFE